MPSFVGAGTYAFGAGAVVPGLTVGWAEDDIFCLIVQNDGRQSEAADPTGYLKKISIAANTGGAASDQARTTLYWKRATPSESDPTVADTGNHTSARILTFRDVITTGDPFDNVQTSFNDTLSTAISVTGFTTTVDGAMVFVVTSSGDDQTVGSWVNSNLVSITTGSDDMHTVNSDGSLASAYGILTTAGPIGASTATGSKSERQANICVALLPALSVDELFGQVMM